MYESLTPRAQPNENEKEHMNIRFYAYKDRHLYIVLNSVQYVRTTNMYIYVVVIFLSHLVGNSYREWIPRREGG